MMEDDIEDLLDEVESKYCTTEKVKVDTRKKTSQSNNKTRAKLEDDIADILGVDDDLPQIKDLPHSGRTSSKSKANENRPDSSKKCFPIYIGNSTCAQGMASSVNKRTCDKLRCTSCDFKVAQFDNFEWHPDIDYLFLRNNAPEFSKLKSRLLPKKGVRAYCCQCSWRSIKDVQMKMDDPALKWVCGRH